MKEQESILDELEGLRDDLLRISSESHKQANGLMSDHALYWLGYAKSTDFTLRKVDELINRAKEREQSGCVGGSIHAEIRRVDKQ